MNDDLKSMMDGLLSPSNLQPKIDILESNISSNLIISKDELEAKASILREGTVDEVIDKAIKQFFEHIQIPESFIGSELSQALNHKFKENKDQNIKLQFEIRDHPENAQTRNIEIIISENKVDITITGYAEVQPKNEKIAKYYFEHEQDPGKVLPNGKIDYREQNNFPAIKQNDRILFVRYPVAGRNGVTYSGRHLLIQPPKEMTLTINPGIIKKEILNEDGTRAGYFLKAADDGVIIIKKTDGKISEIDVSNEIKLDKVDFSTGNIGGEIKLPISMEIGEIGNEFKVNIDGRIKVENLNGGIIDTDQNAVVTNVRDHSKITAKNNIKSKIVADSFLESIDGTVLIEGDIRDSKIKAPKINFICRKGLMLNNTINTGDLTFKGGYYCGVNIIFLGKKFFEKKLEVLETKGAYEQTNEQIVKAIEEIKAKLVPDLKEIASRIKDESTMDNYRILIRNFQSLEFNAAIAILADLKEKLNIPEIDSIRKSFTNLEALAIKQIGLESELKKVENDLSSLEDSINNIKFHIMGEINPTATIKFFCKKYSKDDPPVFEIKTTNKDKNESIDISGTFNLKDGFVVN